MVGGFFAGWLGVMAWYILVFLYTQKPTTSLTLMLIMFMPAVYMWEYLTKIEVKQDPQLLGFSLLSFLLVALFRRRQSRPAN